MCGQTCLFVLVCGQMWQKKLFRLIFTGSKSDKVVTRVKEKYPGMAKGSSDYAMRRHLGRCYMMCLFTARIATNHRYLSKKKSKLSQEAQCFAIRLYNTGTWTPKHVVLCLTLKRKNTCLMQWFIIHGVVNLFRKIGKYELTENLLAITYFLLTLSLILITLDKWLPHHIIIADQWEMTSLFVKFNFFFPTLNIVLRDLFKTHFFCFLILLYLTRVVID